MDSTLFDILFFLFTVGGILLLIFSIMAFCKVEGLEIEKGKHSRSGAILIIDAVIYAILAFLCKRKSLKINKPEEQKEEFIEMQNLNIN